MRIGRREFAPSMLMTGVYLAVGITMLLLAKWQLSRAAEKVFLLEKAETAQSQPAVPIEELIGPARARNGPQSQAQRQPANPSEDTFCQGEDCPSDFSSLEFMILPGYARVVLTGELQIETQFLWDNRIHKGVAGYEVITPLRLADGRLVLINRGWVATGLSRDVLPDVSTQAINVTLEGVLTFPSKGLFQGQALIDRVGWPKVIQYLDFPVLETALQSITNGDSDEIVPALIQGLRKPGSDASQAATEPGLLYPDNWKPVANGPEKHYGYAFQWFAMFAALSFLFFHLNSRRV